MKSRYLLAVGVLAASVVAPDCWAEEEKASGVTMSTDLTHDDPSRRAAALRALERQRSKQVVELVNAAKQVLRGVRGREIEKNSKPYVLIASLGLVRASESAELLGDFIDLRLAGFYPRSPREKLGLDAGFPALHALIGVGSPSLAVLLRTARSSDSGLKRHLAVVGLVRILGNRADLAKSLLQAEQEANPGEVSDGNINACLMIMKRKDFLTSY